ncbi:unnamed protein product [Caretta caretta]
MCERGGEEEGRGGSRLQTSGPFAHSSPTALCSSRHLRETLPAASRASAGGLEPRGAAAAAASARRCQPGQSRSWCRLRGGETRTAEPLPPPGDPGSRGSRAPSEAGALRPQLGGGRRGAFLHHPGDGQGCKGNVCLRFEVETRVIGSK